MNLASKGLFAAIAGFLGIEQKKRAGSPGEPTNWVELPQNRAIVSDRDIDPMLTKTAEMALLGPCRPQLAPRYISAQVTSREGLCFAQFFYFPG